MTNKLNIKFNRDFTVLPNQILKDSRLSFKAKGIWCQLISLPEGWNFSISGLAALAKESDKAIRSGLSELIEFGYLEWRKTRNEYNQFSVEVNVFLPEPYAETLHGETATGQNATWRYADNKESNNKELNSNKELNNISGDSSNRDIVPFKKERPRDLIWDAVVDAYGIVKPTSVERGKLNKAVKELKDVGATPEEIFERKGNYEKLMPGAASTPMALVGNWNYCTRENVNALVTSKQRDKAIEEFSGNMAQEEFEQRTFERMLAEGKIDVDGNEIKRKEIG